MLYITDRLNVEHLADTEATLYVRVVSHAEARHVVTSNAEVVSLMRDAALARVISPVLGCKITPDGGEAQLQAGDELLVVHYRGPRLADNAMVVPEGGRITLRHVRILPGHLARRVGIVHNAGHRGAPYRDIIYREGIWHTTPFGV